MAKDKIIELPEVQEFLKVTRIFERQLNLIKKNNIPEEYKDIIDIALVQVNQTIQANL